MIDNGPFWLIVLMAATAVYAASDCPYGETKLHISPYCAPPNVNVTIQFGSALCGEEYCHLLANKSDTCPPGTQRGTLKFICRNDCEPPKIVLHAKPYCVTRGCEDEFDFAYCVSNRLTKVLDSDSDKCPEGSELGQQRHVCFDEDVHLQVLCPPGDRNHLPVQFAPYCVPSGFEDHLLAPLQRMMPICGDGKPCLQLNRWMSTCPMGTVAGKRGLRCSFPADICMCPFHNTKIHVPTYCYPDTEDFHYSPYCGHNTCTLADVQSGDCPIGTLKGPIQSFCGPATCGADAVIPVLPYCEPAGQASYLVLGNGTALCGKQASTCPTPDAISGVCPPGTNRGTARDVCEAKSIINIPFTLRLIVRPFCVSYPIYTSQSVFSPSVNNCGYSNDCHFLNSTLDACPQGMFRGEHKLVFIPDPNASQCPPFYSGMPPFCFTYSGYGGVAPNFINPNVVKSLIG